MANFVGILLLAATVGLGVPASGGSGLEQQISHLFVGHVVTLRHFYRGNNLQYGSAGQLLGKSEPGYYSRDGMIEIDSVKLSRDGELVMRGKRVCLLLDPQKGELSNVWTGDKIGISVQFGSAPLNFAAATGVLEKVFFTAQDDLTRFVPPYWRNCVQQKLVRSADGSHWECSASSRIPDFAGKKVSWEAPPVDSSLVNESFGNGMQMYHLSHRVAYLTQDGMVAPQLISAPDPLFQWIQIRARLLAMTIVISLAVDADGTPSDISVVSPVGMGMDDQSAEAVAKWHFQPARCKGQPCAVQARVFLDITPVH